MQHKIVPIVRRNLEVAGRPGRAAPMAQFLREDCERNLRRNLYLTKELVNLATAFGAAGINAVPYKGPVLASIAYGDLTLRVYDDLDFFVPHGELRQAARLLKDVGFVTENNLGAGALPPGQYLFRKDGGQCVVEVHTERTLRYYPRPIDVQGLLARATEMTVAGSVVTSFAPEDLLMILSVHGAKHFWERLGWICDFATFVDAAGEMNWDHAVTRARQAKCERMVLLGLFLAAELLEAKVPAEFFNRAQRNSAVCLLAQGIVASLFCQTDRSRGLVQRSMFRVQSSDSFSGGIRYILRLAISPADGDLAADGGAGHVSATMERVMRPWRLLRKYGWTPPPRP